VLLPSHLLDELSVLVEDAAVVAQSEREHLVRELKPDGSIVTSADRKVETFFRARLESLLPGSAVWGEEFGYEADSGSGLWLIDPIDGTSNFAYGSPLWGISAALAIEGEIVLGVIDLPDLGETYQVERGCGAALNGKALPPIPPAPFRAEELCGFCEAVARRVPRENIPGKMRCSGAFVVEGAFVATQRYRGLVGLNEKLYDVAPAVLMGRELGADVRFLDGGEFVDSEWLTDRSIDRPWVIFPMGM
jgi:myo-inositol-1(or 4)-monophosphatase